MKGTVIVDGELHPAERLDDGRVLFDMLWPVTEVEAQTFRPETGEDRGEWVNQTLWSR